MGRKGVILAVALCPSWPVSCLAAAGKRGARSTAGAKAPRAAAEPIMAIVSIKTSR